jgi:hypothetical protein
VNYNRNRLPIVSISLLLSGCGVSENAPPTCGEGEPELVLGSADTNGTGFLSLHEGQSVSLVSGIQGGFHVWFQFRAKNLCADSVVINRATTWMDGVEITHAAEILSLVEPEDHTIAAEGWFELRAARTAILCPSPKNVVGVPIRMQAIVMDKFERSAAAGITIMPTCPTDAQSTTCAILCSGE